MRGPATDRDYHYGVAPQVLASMHFMVGDRHAFDVTLRDYFVSKAGGLARGGHDNIARADVANVRVRGDNSSNGWTNSGLVVRRGQRLRISASGRVSLGNNRFSTPDGLPNVPDREKLMRNSPTGGLIAVIGDDNDDFIFVGSSRDFVAQRDGVLFLGVNEGNLSDNTGTFEVTIEAEAGGSR